MKTISLNGIWQYEPLARVTLKPGDEPSRDETDLYPAGVVAAESTEDLPAGGDMELPANWQLGGLDNFHGRVRFERRFQFDGLQTGEASAWLCFKAVDYYAKVRLNGQWIGSHEGYFQPFSFDVTRHLKAGENHLEVEVCCPKEEPGTIWPNQKLLLKGILSHWDCRPGSWDPATGQDLNSGGIWHDVSLETRPEAYTDHVQISTKLVPLPDPGAGAPGLAGRPDPDKMPRQAMVTVDCDLIGPPGEYHLVAEIAGETVRRRIRLQRSGDRHSVLVNVRNPRLWWTRDLGEPHLETCRITLEQQGAVCHRKEVRTGLREVRVDEEKGQWFLNGERLFIRGTNIVPTLWLGEYDEEMIRKDIALMTEAHMNAVRVCVHINREEFYTACDEAGLLVWQDFAFQWGYQNSPAFLQQAVSQCRDMVRMLINHPSIALWCTQNESGLHNRYVLAPLMAEAIAKEDSSRCIHPISEVKEHAYPGWYRGHYRDFAEMRGKPMCTEFGAQALPSVAMLQKMVGKAWPPDWSKLAYHDFQYEQTFNIAAIDPGDSWETFVENSQKYQAKVLKFAIEGYRRKKYRVMGSLFQFMLVDCWPSVTWSVVDYERVPKAGYRTLQQVYQPVLIAAPVGIHMPERISLRTAGRQRPKVAIPWVCNDLKRELRECRYTLEVRGRDYSDTFESTEFSVPADTVSTRVPPLPYSIRKDARPGTYTYVFRLFESGKVLSENHYEVEFLEARPGGEAPDAGVSPG